MTNHSKFSDFAATLQSDLLALGVRPGGLLMVHSSMRALLGHGAPCPDNAPCPDDVSQGLLAALGPEGTLLMPALTFERVTPDHPVFDIRNTPSNVGVIPETFRTRPGTLRSLHPTHSVCAAGAQAAELTAAHAADSTPCGPHSPFRALAARGGRILFLGCGLEANTFMHAVEEIVVPPYLYDPPIAYRLILADGTELRKTYTPHNFRGWRQRYDRAAEILRPPDLVRTTVAGAASILIDAGALWDAARGAMAVDPLFFVEPVDGVGDNLHGY
jgi:aminoglycoside 3-N-acetyltransferase